MDKDKEYLLRKVSRNSAIVGELKGSNAWKMVCEDFDESKRRIDDAWAFIPENDKDKLAELRISKLALVQIMNLVENYEHDLKVASEQLSKIDDPEAFSKVNYGEKE